MGVEPSLERVLVVAQKGDIVDTLVKPMAGKIEGRARAVPEVGDILAEPAQAGKVARAQRRPADHGGRHPDLVLVEQVEQARDALVDAVLEGGVGGQVRQAVLDGIGDDAARPEMGCPPASNMSEKLTARRAPFGHRGDRVAHHGLLCAENETGSADAGEADAQQRSSGG